MKIKDCIFCNYEAKYIIKETELAIATYFPRAIKKGHVVVAVKEHLPTFTDLMPDQASEVITLALEISKEVKRLVGGCEKVYPVGIGDKDPHFHIHLFPKLKTDAPMGVHIMSDLGWKSEVGEDVSDDDVQVFIAELKAKLKI